MLDEMGEAARRRVLVRSTDSEQDGGDERRRSLGKEDRNAGNFRPPYLERIGGQERSPERKKAIAIPR